MGMWRTVRNGGGGDFLGCPKGISVATPSPGTMSETRATAGTETMSNTEMKSQTGSTRGTGKNQGKKCRNYCYILAVIDKATPMSVSLILVPGRGEGAGLLS